MISHNQDELITHAINIITEKLSVIMLKEFLKLDKKLQINLILIKSAQLLLANVLCQIATSQEELEKILDEQGAEIKELAFNCAFTGFAEKFKINTH